MVFINIVGNDKLGVHAKSSDTVGRVITRLSDKLEIDSRCIHIMDSYAFKNTSADKLITVDLLHKPRVVIKHIQCNKHIKCS